MSSACSETLNENKIAKSLRNL